MTISPHSWRSMEINRAALLDELVKLGEKELTPSKRTLHILKSMAVGSAGGALGYGIAEFAGRKMKFFQEPTHERQQLATKIILPILSGAAVMLADRYRQKMNEQYEVAKGFKSKGPHK